MVSYPSVNLVDSTIDEVALEGLDGITLEVNHLRWKDVLRPTRCFCYKVGNDVLYTSVGNYRGREMTCVARRLTMRSFGEVQFQIASRRVIDIVPLYGSLWMRLGERFHSALPFPKAFMTQIWSICVQVKEFMFYELPEPREPLVIFDRYEFVDPDLGIILEPDDVPRDIYPHYPVQDVENGVKGSCATYYTRKEITKIVRKLSLDKVFETYGETLVVVASQYVRDHALMGVEVCPILELNVMQHCFLERVGRSRYHGEVTQGKLSLNALKEDPKSLFYHRKFLLRHKLITKQLHHQKSSGHSCNGSLLHLPRFFVERKPKVIFLAERVIEILKTKQNYIAEYDEIKKKLQIENSIKKLFKTAFFQKVVRTDLRAPYRTLYPNAEPSEWQQKNNPSRERMIKVVQLLIPDIDISEVWNKDEIQEEDDPQELDITHHKYNIPYLKQANGIIESTKSDGVCQGGLSREMGLTKLQSRTILRNLVKTKIVATYMDDMGRQRLAKFVSKKFEKGSKMSKQFNKEMHRIKELTKEITTESNIQTHANTIKSHDGLNETAITKRIEISEEVNASPNKENEKNVENVIAPPGVKSPNKLIATFRAINCILRKYRLTKYTTKYKYTYLNLSFNLLDKGQLTDSRKDPATPSSITDISGNYKAASLYNNVKTYLTTLTPQNTRKTVNEVFGFMEDVKKNEKKNVSNITYRLLRRANMIIESVMEHQVIDDMTKLMKMIHEEEDKEGYDVKIDKKSLIRLLQRLAKDNLVKNIKLTLSASGREKHLTFICDPNIGTDHAVIQSAVEQAKLKFCLVVSQKGRSSAKQTAKPESDKETLNRSEAVQKSGRKSKITPSESSEYNPKAARRYGYSPKFVRMQAMHILLFYLVYEHPGEQKLSKAEQIKALRANGFNITDELTEEFNTLYTTEIGWRMFVPPLPKHCGWPRGWTLMCDVLLRMPLSIFLKIHYVPFVVPNLENYINHPVRKHYLVRDLPTEVRNPLLFQRKYIFGIHQTVTRLCYIGLTQFGPQRLKEKDQVFIYVNRQAELLDTTSSAPSYHIIEDKSYPVIRYKFDKMQIIEKYWYDMWNTCINTPLGGRLVVQGKDILLEELSKKVDMMKAVEARAPEDAAKLDTGQIPGDRKGAAGLDSAYFAHLKRNWNWSFNNSHSAAERQAAKVQQKAVPLQREAYLSKIKAKPLKFTEFVGLKKISGPISVSTTELRRKTPRQKLEESANQERKCEPLAPHCSTKQKSFVRRVLPRKCKSRRTKYDEIDYRALQRMSKLRVDWEPYEDKILLVCKVVMMYLCPNPHKQVVTFTAVRDVLRTYSFSSHNKTSRACQRRLLYMLRNPQTVNSVTVGVEEMKQNFYVTKRFGGITDKLKAECKNSHEYEKRVTEIFKTLVQYIARKYYDISEAGPKKPQAIPLTAQEFNVYYKIEYPTKSFINRGFTRDVQTVNDIHSAIINSVIHSSMCCAKDRRSWAYQLFKVYQQYPEVLLRNAMAKIRSDQMVTIKKNHMCTIKKYGNYMPMSSSQYQLSTNYIYKFHTKWPYDIFKETHDVFTKLIQWCSKDIVENSNENLNEVNGIEITPVTGGIVGAVHDYVAQNKIDFDIELPDQIIMLDPRLKEMDETYYRIAERYQDVLVCLDHLKLAKETPVCMDVQEYDVQDEECSNSELAHLNNRMKGYFEYNDNSNTKNVDVIAEKADNLFGDLDAQKDISFRVAVSEDKRFEEMNDFIDSDDFNFDSDEDSFHNAAEEDSNVIKLQDGMKIILHRNDIEGTASFKYTNSGMDIQQVEASTEDKQKNLPPEKTSEKFYIPARHAENNIGDSSTVEKVIPTDINHLLLSADLNPAKNEISPSLRMNTNREDAVSKLTANKRPKHSPTENVDEPLEKKAKYCSEIGHIGYTSKDGNNKNGSMTNAHGPFTKTNIPIQTITTNNAAKTCDNDQSEERTNNVKQSTKDTDKTEVNIRKTVRVDSKKANEAGKAEKENKDKSSRVNNILRNICSENYYLNPYCKIDETNDTQKRYTRIALLKMREELSGLTTADSHHAHEYFAVNTFKMFYSLKIQSSENIEKFETFKDLKVPSESLPLETTTVNELTRHISNYAVFPKHNISYSEYKKTFSKNTSPNLNAMDAVYKFVRDKKEIGVSIQELLDNFEDELGKEVHRIIALLTENHLLLRTGVTTVRYIHHRHAGPWLIHSYKILTLERESLLPIPKGTVYLTESATMSNTTTAAEVTGELHGESNTTPNERSQTDSVPVTEYLSNISTDDLVTLNEFSSNVSIAQSEEFAKEQSGNSDGEHGAQARTRMQRKRTRLLPQRDVSRSAKQLDFNTAEEIRVVVKPWIRIDGGLNRRVLDRMLGAVLAYCLTHPGITLSKVQNRFVPALQPFHTRELVEMLLKLECLEETVMKKPSVTLFSKPSPIRPRKVNHEWPAENDIILEPALGAMLKFGAFLSTKMYTNDYIT